MGFRAMLAKRQKEVGSYVCAGLDPLPDKLPDVIRKSCGGVNWQAIALWMCEIADAVAPHVSMFKPQKAHYEAIPEGQKALQMINAHIHYRYPGIAFDIEEVDTAGIVSFEDCKRGDIGRTQQRYRIAQFGIDNADGMNFSPYMGKDCMQHLVDEENFPGRAIVGLCYTSNPSAREMQDVKLADGRCYWEMVAEKTLQWAEGLGIVNNAGLVMAAAYESPKGSGDIFSWHLSRCREIVGNKLWFLIPGIGTQGGFVRETVKTAYAGPGSMAINSSSGIIFASQDNDFAEMAGRKAEELKNQINQYI